jgi:hypothetical protein
MPPGVELKLDLFCALRPGRFSLQAQDRPRTAQVSWPQPDLSHIPDIGARLSMEPLSFEWPFPAVADPRGEPAGMLDRDDLELHDERGQWTSEICVHS